MTSTRQDPDSSVAPVAEGPLIVAAGVETRVGSKQLIGPLDFTLNAGELVVLLGPNGAGKSTLLTALAGDHRTAGDLEICGHPSHRSTLMQLARQRAVLPQNPTISFPFRVHEVVAMGRTPWDKTSDLDDAEVIESAMEATEVVHLRDRVVSSLSGGEQARVAVARIFAQRTPIILMDEPTAAMDLRHQERTFDHLRELCDDGAGVVVVVHDLGIAGAHADRILVMDQGLIAIAGTPENPLDTAVLSEVYRHRIDVIESPDLAYPLLVPFRRVRRGSQQEAP
ncbi:MAG: heme ABC transporter ATP-binding protein [Microthrixaceae bacterium]|nr:heme ABC transporter ATP-binding protein [Microthrixaceae bacterium]